MAEKIKTAAQNSLQAITNVLYGATNLPSPLTVVSQHLQNLEAALESQAVQIAAQAKKQADAKAEAASKAETKVVASKAQASKPPKKKR